ASCDGTKSPDCWWRCVRPTNGSGCSISRSGCTARTRRVGAELSGVASPGDSREVSLVCGMPHAKTEDGVRLYYEEAGSGTPLIFVHEFAGDHRSWEPQMRHF